MSILRKMTERPLMQISYLADHPEFIESLAPAIFEHWCHILTEQTLDSRIGILREHMNRDSLPIAWVAHDEFEVFGTAALRRHDLQGREDLEPWLGRVFVVKQYRRRGIGEGLCTAVENHARQARVDTLYLFTLDSQHWYRKLGWKNFESCQWR